MTARHFLTGVLAGAVHMLLFSNRVDAQGAASAASSISVVGDVRTPMSLGPDDLKGMPVIRLKK